MAAQYLYLNNQLFGRILEEKSPLFVGYRMFVFLKAYEDIIENGKEYIVNAIYEENGLKYLEDMAGHKGMNNIQEYLALKNLSQDYTNKNLIAHPDYEYSLYIEGEIEKDFSDLSVELFPIGMTYYKIKRDYDDTAWKIKVDSYDKNNIRVHIIGENNGNYTMFDSNIIADGEKIINSYDYEYYDNLYVCVTNGSLQTTSYFDISIMETEKKENLGNLPNYLDFETEVNNYEIKMTMDLTVNIGGFEMSTESISEGIVDELHQKQYMIIETVLMGFSVDTEIYTDFNAGISYTSQPFVNQWVKSPANKNFIDLKSMTDKFKDQSMITKISDDKYKVKLTKEEIREFVKSNNPDANISTISNDAYIDVYIKDKFIYKIDFDLSNIVDEVSEYIVSIEYSNYNSAGDVEIPNKVINNAMKESNY